MSQTTNVVEIVEPIKKPTTHRFISDIYRVIPETELSVEEMNTILENHNPINRPINKSRISKLKEAINNGNWNSHTGNPVKFLKSGILAGGQHRFKSHVEVNKPLTALVVCGLDPKSLFHDDDNLPRNYANRVLFSREEEQTKEAVTDLVKQSRLARAYLTHVVNSNKVNCFNDYDLMDIINQKKEIFDFILTSPKGVTSRHPFFAACIKYIEKDPEKGKEFFNDVMKGTDLQENSAKLALHDYLESIDGKGNGGSFGSKVYKATITSINKHVAGEPTRYIDLAGKNAKHDIDFNF